MDFEQFERIGTMVARYHLQPKAEPERRHFDDWVNSLGEPMKTDFRKKGFDKCKDVLNFRRFALELKDRGLEEHMKANLSEADYIYWQQL